MFDKIQSMKKRGVPILHIAKELELDRKTVRRYHKMTHEQFQKYNESMKRRGKFLDSYFNMIHEVYEKNNFRKLNMAAVYDYLEERVGSLNCSERTLRNYINYLIITGKLQLKETVRMYEKVPQLPYGKQMQMDFGQYKFSSGLKVYLFVVLLSSSRYKYVSVQNSPFTTKTVIKHMLKCFDYFGGVPEELVIDQDAVLVNSENSGDIIYTKEFSYFIHEMNLKMYVCRKADPESKGKVENLVGYVKKNFLSIRNYSDIKELSADMESWLTRRANGKISCSTGIIPSNAIKEERKFLRPIRNSIFNIDVYAMEERIVDEHSFIAYQSSFYSVPTNFKKIKVKISVILSILYIYQIDGSLITEHEISNISQQKVIKREHFRETEKKAKTLKEEILNMHESLDWKKFANESFIHFPRYVRDQCILAKKYFLNVEDQDCFQKAISNCLENKLFSFKNLSDAMKYFMNQRDEHEVTNNQELPEIIKSNVRVVNVETRDIGEYSKIINAIGGAI